MTTGSEQFKADMKDLTFAIKSVSEKDDMIVFQMGDTKIGSFNIGVEKSQLDGNLGTRWPDQFPGRICLNGTVPADDPEHIKVVATEPDTPDKDWTRYTVEIDDEVQQAWHSDEPGYKNTFFRTVCYLVGISIDTD